MFNYTFNTSTTINATELSSSSILVNSLVEKRRYIYYRRGPHYSSNSECGTEHYKLRKEGIGWQSVGRNCSDGSEIFRVFEDNNLE